MNEKYSQEGSGGIDPPGSGGFRGGAPPGQHSALVSLPPTGDSRVDLPPTGDKRVDEAVAGLSRLPGRPADEHVAVLEEVHGRLRDILGELNDDSGQGRP
jgi:hypothetical protein